MIADNQQGKLVPIHSQALSYIVGAYVTDGWIDGNSFNVEVIDLDFADHVELAIHIAYQEKRSIKRYERMLNGTKRYRIMFTNRQLANMLQEDTESKNVTPKWISENRMFFLGYLMGCMDGDGWISVRKGNCTTLSTFAQIAISGKITKHLFVKTLQSPLSKYGFSYAYSEIEDKKNGGTQATINFHKKSFIEQNGMFSIRRKIDRLQMLSDLYEFPQRLKWRPLIEGDDKVRTV